MIITAANLGFNILINHVGVWSAHTSEDGFDSFNSSQHRLYGGISDFNISEKVDEPNTR